MRLTLREMGEMFGIEIARQRGGVTRCEIKASKFDVVALERDRAKRAVKEFVRGRGIFDWESPMALSSVSPEVVEVQHNAFFFKTDGDKEFFFGLPNEEAQAVVKRLEDFRDSDIERTFIQIGKYHYT